MLALAAACACAGTAAAQTAAAQRLPPLSSHSPQAFGPSALLALPPGFARMPSAETAAPFSPRPAATFRLPPSPAPRPVATSIEVSVYATQEMLSTEGVQRSFTPSDVETAPGTFGDLPRFLQTLAGVVADNDQRNDFLVRGGNPSENLFVIDNIEIPSVNQLALSDTTGGLVSMLDNNAIQRFSLLDDAYGSHYDQRLSAVVDISTRTHGRVEPHRELEFGIAGTGGSQSRSFGRNGSFFLSARSGILQYLTDDIGFNGTPHYRNAFARAENSLGAHDTWWGMSLFGIDSIAIHPDPADPGETNPFDIHYGGWRNATGINWQHLFSGKAFAVASLAHTEQTQDIAENAQLQASALVYRERSRDGATTLKYDVTLTPLPSLVVEAGARGSLDQLGYTVEQPLGLQNPYSPDPTPTDASSFAAHRPALTSAVYADATWSLPHGVHLSAGERWTHWNLDGRSALTARAALSASVGGHAVFFNYAEHAQLPPELYLLAFDNLATLRPIRTHQLSAGVAVIDRPRAQLHLVAYSKSYHDYPVAALFPQLSLANISDTFGQAFLLFPMTPQGTGTARGLEATFETTLTPRLTLTGTAAYARTWFAGQDGVLRRGNYDIPAAGNLIPRWTFGKGYTLSGRFNMTSGRPYTPDNMPLSYAQNRDVYDLARINALRSATYQRLDFHFEQTRKWGERHVTWYVGMENALNRANFYAQLWMPHRIPDSGDIAPAAIVGGTQAVQHQIGRFPDAGIKLAF